MQAEDLLDVTVNVAEAGITRQGFGTVLIFAYHTHYTDLAREYACNGGLGKALQDDGFTTSEPAYVAAIAASKQRPRPRKIKIGRRVTPETQVLVLTPTAGAALQTRTFTIEAANGTKYPISFTNDGTPLVAEVCTAIAAAINATAVAMTAVAGATTVTLTADAPNTLHSVYGLDSTVTLTDTTVVSNVAAELDAIRDFDNDWYGLANPSSAPTSIEACADWIEGQEKIYLGQTHDMGVISSSTTDIASSIKSQSYTRTRVMYNARALSFAGLCLMAHMLCYEPGQATWMFKPIVGAVADKLSAAQAGYAYAKNALTYETLYNASFSSDFEKGAGRFLDVQQIIDWVTQRLREGYVAKQLASPKIPYTDAGIGAVMYGVCKNVLSAGIANDAIDPDDTTWTIEVPKVKDIDPADRAARHFPGTELSFRATGATHSADVTVSIAA
jgi:hypothetical protein